MIRNATEADVPLLLHFIRELSRYEKLEHELDMDAGRLRDHLFGASATCGAFLAMDGETAVGFALHFRKFSTFKCRSYLHLEDLFVLPEYRGNGYGLALLRAVAAEAVRSNSPRLEWNVLDWNEPAIGFYRAQGADVLDDWRICRVVGDPLRKLAKL